MSKKERKADLVQSDQTFPINEPDEITQASRLHVARGSRIALKSPISSYLTVDDDVNDINDVSSTSSLQSEYLLVRTTSQRADDFFAIVCDIPSINDIVLSSEEDLDIQITSAGPSMKSVYSGPDIGRFVDPITGEPISSTSSSSVLAIPQIENEATDDEDLDLDISDDALLEEPEIEEQDIENMPEDDLTLWIDFQPARIVHVQEDIDYEALRREEEHHRITEITTLFLEDLIYHIVEHCEYIDPNVLIQKNLNKKELMNKLDDLLKQLDVSQKTHIFLNRKAVDFFRRKRMYRPLDVEDPDTMTQRIESFKTAISRLDQLIDQENVLTTSTEKRKANLLAEVETSEAQFQQNKKQLEDLVKKTLCKDSYANLTAVVQNGLNSISRLRNEISQVRLQLIQKQHDMGRIIEESEKLDYIGEGLSMSHFLALTTQVQSLSKKIEERNSDLSKLRTHFNADLLTRTHSREKSSMIQSEFIIREEVLEELNELKKKCRERLYCSKMERTNLKKALRVLSYKGGLVDKPLLMLDYDKTVARTEKMRDRVAHLKQKISEMQNRLELETRRMS